MSETKSFKGTTKTGFPFDISMERMENYEVVETIAEIDENPLVLPRLLKLMDEVRDIFESQNVKK